MSFNLHLKTQRFGTKFSIFHNFITLGGNYSRPNLSLKLGFSLCLVGRSSPTPSNLTHQPILQEDFHTFSLEEVMYISAGVSKCCCSSKFLEPCSLLIIAFISLGPSDLENSHCLSSDTFYPVRTENFPTQPA